MKPERLPEPCPECGKPTTFLEEVVASPFGGRVREYHRACLERRSGNDPRSVSARLAGILGGRAEVKP